MGSSLFPEMSRRLISENRVISMGELFSRYGQKCTYWSMDLVKSPWFDCKISAHTLSSTLVNILFNVSRLDSNCCLCCMMNCSDCGLGGSAGCSSC